ncbi:helix-turn-helix domain-containing protein [Nocardioides sp.]|uniref:IclR family transcriptional regulator n=1 Tax=Nocardioides sp. TaxID=35761 RepID=UPI0031FEA5FA|nr:hypothetical protein [Nocardioides sp.]
MTEVSAVTTTFRRPSSAIDRVTRVLDAFTGIEGRQSLGEVTAVAGLPRSTVFRILTQLVELNWLDHAARGYELGPRAHGLGSRARDYRLLRAATARPVRALHARTSALIQLGVIEGGWLYLLDEVGPTGYAFDDRGPERLHPAHHALGLSLLASMPAERVDKILRNSKGPQLGAGDSWGLHQQLVAVRRRHGVAVLPDTAMTQGAGTIAAPVAGPEGVVAAISLSPDRAASMAELVPKVASAAREASRELLRITR